MFFFFFNDTATTEIYTLSLHDALPIFLSLVLLPSPAQAEGDWEITPGSEDALERGLEWLARNQGPQGNWRSEEHTSELQSRQYLVCRLLLEKKKKQMKKHKNSENVQTR